MITIEHITNGEQYTYKVNQYQKWNNVKQCNCGCETMYLVPIK